MAIQRWDPVRDLLVLKERLNNMFEDISRARGWTGNSSRRRATAGARQWTSMRSPRATWYGSNLPGVPPADVEIEVDEGSLHVRGNAAWTSACRASRACASSGRRGDSRWSMQLPATVDRGGIQAQHREGVLEIVLPRRKDEGPSRVRVDAS